MGWLVGNRCLNVLCPGDGMEAVHNQQQLLEEGGGGVEMMVMESLDPALLQMKTEVNRSPVSVPSFKSLILS